MHYPLLPGIDYGLKSFRISDVFRGIDKHRWALMG